jgi:hypothetical protein
MTQNKRTVTEYMEAFRRSDHARIQNEAFVGSPNITVARLTEENDIVIAEGSVQWKESVR